MKYIKLGILLIVVLFLLFEAALTISAMYWFVTRFIPGEFTYSLRFASDVAKEYPEPIISYIILVIFSVLGLALSKCVKNPTARTIIRATLSTLAFSPSAIIGPEAVVFLPATFILFLFAAFPVTDTTELLILLLPPLVSLIIFGIIIGMVFDIWEGKKEKMNIQPNQ